MREIDVFIQGIKHYFVESGATEAEVEVPYLAAEPSLPLLDYTGVIGISGGYQGTVYFSASTLLLRRLLLEQGLLQDQEVYYIDLVGEVANIFSGYVCQYLGADFILSPPIAMKGKPDNLMMAKQLHPYVIPFSWHRYQALLVIGIEKATPKIVLQ